MIHQYQQNKNMLCLLYCMYNSIVFIDDPRVTIMKMSTVPVEH